MQRPFASLLQISLVLILAVALATSGSAGFVTVDADITRVASVHHHTTHMHHAAHHAESDMFESIDLNENGSCHSSACCTGAPFTPRPDRPFSVLVPAEYHGEDDDLTHMAWGNPLQRPPRVSL